MVTLNQRLQRAAALHSRGYNCAPCVMLAFADLYADKVGEDAVAAIACALGGGVCGSGNICGAASAMTAVLSLLEFQTPSDKRRIYADGTELIRRFTEIQDNRINCRELKGKCGKPCSALIADAVTVLHNYLAEKG